MPAELVSQYRYFDRQGPVITFKGKEFERVKDYIVDPTFPFIDRAYNIDGYDGGFKADKDGRKSIHCKTHQRALKTADILIASGLKEESGEKPNRSGAHHISYILKSRFRKSSLPYLGEDDDDQY